MSHSDEIDIIRPTDKTRRQRNKAHSTARVQIGNACDAATSRLSVACFQTENQFVFCRIARTTSAQRRMNNFAELLIIEVQKRPVLWNKFIQNSTNRLLVDKEWENVAMLLKRDKEEVRLKWRNLRDQFRRELKKMRKPRSKDPGDPPISNYRGKWVYFEMLLFLKDTMIQKRTEDCFNNNLANADETECKQDIVNDEDLTITEDSPLTLMSRCSPDVIDISRLSSRNEIPGTVKFRAARCGLEGSQIFEPAVQRKRRKRKVALRLSDFEENMLELENKKLSMLIEKGSSAERHESEIDEDMHFAKSLVPFLRRLNPLRKLVVRNEIQNLLIKELLDESSISSSVSQTSSTTHCSNNNI
ncbi:unnamed protein product [Heterotrigona itama]|uniref:MADF domain-containing protein n=1 Tax=Heterotrigona itama TaxID=395501 RepID=A0A6V7HDN2_9HYME|nr:unnamed protein product [Heterotrigona itama]